MRRAFAAGFAPVQPRIHDQRSTPGAPSPGARRRSTTASEPSRRLRRGCGLVYRASSPRRATGQERRWRSPCREFVMANKMLIDASHPEETRVVVVRGQKVEEFDFESASRRQLRGNIYLAKVTRVEPSLQAAFVEYGGNRHGFLAFSEIHPDYYQIPVADRQALLAEDARSARESDDDEPGPRRNRGRRSAPARNSDGASVSSAETGNGEDAQASAEPGSEEETSL